MCNAAQIKARAIELGFDVCGIAPADSFPELRFLDDWLARGYAGEMAWMSRTADRRADVRNVVPGARSVIVTGTIYATASQSDGDAERAAISRYAWGDDYHDVLKERLAPPLPLMRAGGPRPIQARRGGGAGAGPGR